MHDLSVRAASLLLGSGILLFVAFLVYSALYPRKAQAAGRRAGSDVAREVQARLTHS